MKEQESVYGPIESQSPKGKRKHRTKVCKECPLRYENHLYVADGRPRCPDDIFLECQRKRDEIW